MTPPTSTADEEKVTLAHNDDAGLVQETLADLAHLLDHAVRKHGLSTMRIATNVFEHGGKTQYRTKVDLYDDAGVELAKAVGAVPGSWSKPFVCVDRIIRQRFYRWAFADIDFSAAEVELARNADGSSS